MKQIYEVKEKEREEEKETRYVIETEYARITHLAFLEKNVEVLFNDRILKYYEDKEVKVVNEAASLIRKRGWMTELFPLNGIYFKCKITEYGDEVIIELKEVE